MKPKKKFKTADEARLHRELVKNWEVINAKYKPANDRSDNGVLLLPSHRTNRNEIPSLTTPGGNTFAKPTTVYTGTKMLGVAVLHKSNAVPVFTEAEIIDVSAMRR